MRKIIPIMKDWSFTYGKDQSTHKIDLPHTWNNIDGQDGGNDYYRGTCYYTKEIAKPKFSDSELVYLQFHGVNASAKVYLNDKLAMVFLNVYPSTTLIGTEGCAVEFSELVITSKKGDLLGYNSILSRSEITQYENSSANTKQVIVY